MHKATKEQKKEVINISEPKNVNLRPKVGETKCPTIRLDLNLKLLTKHPKSKIKDNIKFLKACKQNVTADTVLATFDVYSLCTNTQHEFGLRAIEYFVSN